MPLNPVRWFHPQQSPETVGCPSQRSCDTLRTPVPPSLRLSLLDSGEENGNILVSVLGPQRAMMCTAPTKLPHSTDAPSLHMPVLYLKLSPTLAAGWLPRHIILYSLGSFYAKAKLTTNTVPEWTLTESWAPLHEEMASTHHYAAVEPLHKEMCCCLRPPEY